MDQPENVFAKEWDRIFVERLNSNFLLDSLKGRIAFLCGAAFVLNELQDEGGLTADYLREQLQAYIDSLPWTE